MIENQVLRTGYGKEYVTRDLEIFLRHEIIQHHKYAPQQNGVSERKNRTLTEMTKCMLLELDCTIGFGVIYLFNKTTFK